MSLESFELLLMQLHWPVPMNRITAAKEISKLITKPESKELRKRFLAWLKSRTLEIEVANAIAILGLSETPPIKLSEVLKNIKAPSLLSDMYLKDVYNVEVSSSWLHSHSGVPDDDYVPSTSFENKKVSHLVAPIIHNGMLDLEKKSGLPFILQWAWEYDSLQKVHHCYSPHPDYFLDSMHRREVSGQYFLREMDIFFSAYLRTISFAVSNWKVPLNYASFYAGRVVGLDTRLARVEASPKPLFWPNVKVTIEVNQFQNHFQSWLNSLLDLKDGEEILVGARGSFVRNGNFAVDVDIAGVVCQKGYVLTQEEQLYLHEKNWLSAIWDDKFITGERLPANITEDIDEKFTSSQWQPLAYRLYYMIHYPRWLTDRLADGLLWPEPNYFSETVRATYTDNEVLFNSDSQRIGRLVIWHDDWEQSYLKGLGTGVGMALFVEKRGLKNLLKNSGDDFRIVGRSTELRRARDYDEFTKLESCFISEALT